MKPNKLVNVKSYAFFKKLFGESWADLSKRYTELFGIVVGRNRCPLIFTTSFQTCCLTFLKDKQSCHLSL